MKTSLKIDIYECSVEMHVVNTIKDVEELTKKIFKRYKIEEEIYPSYGITITTSKKYFIIISKEGNYINTFMHELFHCVDIITSDRGIENAEAKAYLQGIIGEKLLKKL